MKACLYCAEKVQDDAVRCRFCGQPLPTDVLDWTERGERYAIGPTLTEGRIGVWEQALGGKPLATYPDDEHGWPQALAHFQQLERGGPSGSGLFGPVLLLLGGALLVLGSFLPWAVLRAPFVGTVNLSGLEGGDGFITLILGVLIALLGLARLTTSRLGGASAWAPLLLAIVAGIVAVIELGEVQGRVAAATTEFSVGSVGAGIWAMLVGSGLAVAGSLTSR